MWVLKVIDSNVTATSRAPLSSFIFGKHNWTIFKDKGCKMSGCKEGKFTCNDGQCVSMVKRCDQFPDCSDESDEMNCEILVLNGGYNKKVPLVTSKDPVNVSISIDVLELVDIDEEDYSIEIQFEIALVWKEKRARFQNLMKRDSLNTLSEKGHWHALAPKSDL